MRTSNIRITNLFGLLFIFILPSFCLAGISDTPVTPNARSFCQLLLKASSYPVGGKLWSGLPQIPGLNYYWRPIHDFENQLFETSEEHDREGMVWFAYDFSGNVVERSAFLYGKIGFISFRDNLLLYSDFLEKLITLDEKTQKSIAGIAHTHTHPSPYWVDSVWKFSGLDLQLYGDFQSRWKYEKAMRSLPFGSGFQAFVVYRSRVSQLVKIKGLDISKYSTGIPY